MIRRTLLLPEQLDQRLIIASKLAGKSFSDFVRGALDALLKSHELGQVKQMYKVLNEIKGAGDPTLVDASTTIDKVLYGENGAWRGTIPPSKKI